MPHLGATRNPGLTKQKVPFVLVSCDHGTVILNRLDWRKLSETHNEFGVGTDILVHGQFDFDLISMTGGMLAARREKHGPGVVALDCGANIGIYTLEWARMMTGWGSVIAFEPQERIYYALAGNVAINNLFNAKVLHKAVGDACAEISMPVPDYQLPGQYGGLSLKTGADIGQPLAQGTSVEMLSIDSLALRRVDFIKIDVEGMELEVLDGARATILLDEPYLLVEWHITGKVPIEAFLDEICYDRVTVGMNLICAPKGDEFLPRLESFLTQGAAP